MKQFKRILLVTCFCGILLAQTNIATTAASFLEIGAGARSLALGGAFVSLANDVSALYWNPAGIVNISRPSVQFFHSPWLVDTEYFFSGMVIPMGSLGVLGLTYTAVVMDEMMVRTVQSPEGTGEKFDASSLAMGVAYSKRLTDRFSFGIQFKFVQEKIWQMHAKTLSADIGTLFITENFGDKMGLDGINTAIDADVDKNIYGNNDRIDAHLDAAKWPLPLLFRFGVSRDLIFSGDHRFTVSTDANHPNNNVEYVNAGAEYTLKDLISLRIGRSDISNNDAEQGLSYGAGINYRIPRGPLVRLDYVFRPFGVFQTVTGFSIDITF